MKEDFGSAMENKGVDCKFYFNGNNFHLTTYNDASGQPKVIKMTGDMKSLALQAAIIKESEMFTSHLEVGGTLKSLIDQYPVKKDGPVFAIFIEGGGVVTVANCIWGAAMGILKREYLGEEPVVSQRPVRKDSPFKVIQGGLA